jgi:MFS family permease
VRALAHRNFRLYFFGQGVSVLGTWMQQVAVAWMVYGLTGSPLWLGLVAFAGQIPALVISPVAGVLIDRVNRHRLVLLTQALAMGLALTLAALAFGECVTVWHLVALSLLGGVVDAFDIPARQFLLTELVGRGDDLANAIALNSSLFNAARLVGPTVAGFLLAWTNAGVCFLANGASYLTVLAALLAMRLPAH